jgi:undecaprenyl-diphosphatase
MSYFHALIIAIIEGITEFLPISSTAHVKMANPLLGIQPDSAFTNLFEVVIQLAAIFSVVIIYWKKFIDLKNVKFYIKLVIAVIPALIVGALFKKHIDAALSNLTFIACVMIGGGIILLFIDKLFTKNNVEDEHKITYPNAFTIGCFQVLSIVLPGLSRSAATIVGGMSQKLSRKLAAEFSFYLAVPTMFAASVKQFYDVYKEHPEVLVKDNMSVLLVGGVISFVLALLAVKFFIGYVTKYGFKLFGWYRIIVGVAFLVYLFYKASSATE